MRESVNGCRASLNDSRMGTLPTAAEWKVEPVGAEWEPHPSEVLVVIAPIEQQWKLPSKTGRMVAGRKRSNQCSSEFFSSTFVLPLFAWTVTKRDGHLLLQLATPRISDSLEELFGDENKLRKKCLPFVRLVSHYGLSKIRLRRANFWS